MGVVYSAQQLHPIRRDVAVKVIKPGMDSAQVIARFESERQALAMMDHPNIARVFDAGTTTAGMPYFAMELVEGIPITQYCDSKTPEHSRADRAFHTGLPRHPARPPKGNHPPRSQTVEHPGEGTRGPPRGQGDRLRSGQGAWAAIE
jgi:serine/threonine protein kinase